MKETNLRRKETNCRNKETNYCEKETSINLLTVNLRQISRKSAKKDPSSKQTILSRTVYRVMRCQIVSTGSYSCSTIIAHKNIAYIARQDLGRQ